MIKYNLNTINDWNFGDDNIIKVYKHGAVCYYKITSGDTPTPVQEPCFAVVDDITQYSDTEFENVYDKATEKWYKLNNLNEYEEYGVYGSGRTITTYEGKLTIDEGDDGEDYSTHYLTLVAQTDNVTFSYSTATSSNKLQYSVDSGSTWNDLSNGSSTSPINNGDKIMFKASGLTVNTERGIGKIIPSASASVEGNIMSLEYGDNFSGQTTIQNNYQFRKLFSGVTTITSAENMVLPATTLKQQCYSQMFQGCTNLVKTPKTIGSSAMIWSGSYCFSNLFSYCTSLTTVPSGLLPALNLGSQCYWYMFEGCSGLTTAPDLPATTTASQCYQGMFINCSSLNYITVLTTNNFTMNDWLSGVAASGTFVKNPNATWSSCGQNAYPCGWTVQDYVEPTPIKYEYIYSGGSWVNLGEVSGGTITIKSPEYIEKTSSFNGYCSLLEYLTEDTKIIVKHRQTGASGGSFIGDYFNNDNDDWRVFFASSTLYYDFITQRKSTRKTMPMSAPEEWEIGNYYIKNTATSTNLITGTHQSFSSRPNQMYLYYLGGFGNVSDYGQVYYIKIYRGEALVRDFIPWTDMNGNYGLYDKVEGELVHTVGNMTASTVINDVEVGGGYEYPLEYPVIQDPPNNITFTSMTEAESYECPYVGMNATIDGDKYIFSGDSQSGYEWVYQSSRLPQGYTEVEYVQNTSHAYLDIGFILDQDSRIVCDMQQVTENSFPRLWGAGEWNSANGINLNYEGGYLQMSWFGKTSWTKITSVTTNNDRHTYDLNKNYLYVDETLVGSNTYNTKTAAASIGIFCEIKNNGQPPTSGNNPQYWEGEYFKGKMYSFKVYDNGTLVRDLVPCIRDNDDTVGAYDIVNNVFYTVPSGYTTDKLIAGNPI